MPIIYFTVTNDLTYDQRMIRICTSLANAGYDVTLVGRSRKHSVILQQHVFKQKRTNCFFEKGKLFYAEYNIRLFFLLLFKKMDGICAIDLDTILPCYLLSKIKKIKRIYDAHELFCEMKEVVSRPLVYKMWKWIEQKTVPHFDHGYTVNEAIAAEFYRMYGKRYAVIRSISVYQPEKECKKEKFVLYQGAVNEGRCFENIIPAMQWVQAPLYICGDGNYMIQARQLAEVYNVETNIHFQGMISPLELRNYTNRSWIGLTLFEKEGLSNYYSLANRFFDYIHAGTPQICVGYPAYHEINNRYNVAVLIEDLSPGNIAKEINSLLQDTERWQKLHNNCLLAAQELNWQMEQQKLLEFYKNIFG